MDLPTTHLQYALDMQLSQLEKVCLTPSTSDDMLCRCIRVTNAAMMVEGLSRGLLCLGSYQRVNAIAKRGWNQTSEEVRVECLCLSSRPLRRSNEWARGQRSIAELVMRDGWGGMIVLYTDDLQGQCFVFLN